METWLFIRMSQPPVSFVNAHLPLAPHQELDQYETMTSSTCPWRLGMAGTGQVKAKDFHGVGFKMKILIKADIRK